MSQSIAPLLHPDDLLKLQHNHEIVLIDARAGANAEENYKNQHLKGARYVDLNQDLAAVKADPANGGRHPLPSLEKFAAVLSYLGISPTSHVVVYDDKNGSNAAARFWWMLRAVGHEKIQVLNGGLQAALKADLPVNSGTENFKAATPYPVSQWKLAQATIDQVETARNNKESIVIDVRDKNRFDGLTEPLDLIAGHIPGAINIPFSENLDENGFYKTPAVLAEKYKPFFNNVKPENSIVHCGSGVTACHTLLALDYAGIPIPQLYVGSWSEWSRNDRELFTIETK